MYIPKRQRHNILISQLDQERTSHIQSWRDIGENMAPAKPRFMLTDTNRGDRRNQSIIDNTGILAARTLRSGMMSGITSPARPWFRLTTPDPALAEFGRVKAWLHIVGTRMSSIYARSNLYQVLPLVYGDMGLFGTAAMFVEEDFDTVINCQAFPIGTYWLAKDHRGRVNTFGREFRMTVRNLVNKFGKNEDGSGKPDWSKFSETVKTAYEAGKYETWIDVRHIIAPNPDYNPRSLLSKHKKFESCYYEKNSGIDQYGEGKYLRESGYDFFPILAPRWEATGEDVYSTEYPGIASLGDAKQLQLGEKRSLQAIEKMINPPMIGNSNSKGQKHSILPGDITWEDESAGSKGFRPAHEVRFSIQELEGKQEQVRNRVKRAWFEDLFLMISGSSGDPRETATEILEKKEEKLIILGPTLHHTNVDLLDPLTDITFSIAERQGWIPPAPEELQGVPLKIEYISVLQEAQKALGITGVERFIAFVGKTSAETQNMELLDKVDFDQAIDVYSEMTSVPPSIVRTDEQVQAIREGRAQSQAQAQKMEQMAQGAQAAKNLSQASLEGDSALTAMLEQAGG